MAQKILAGRCADPTLSGDVVQVKVDQIVLARAPLRAVAEARELGLKKTTAEVAIAYDTHATVFAGPGAGIPAEAMHGATTDLVAHGIVVAKPGIGYPAPVHLERFASPARLCVTDEPRLAGIGGIGMLTLVVSPGLLGQALAQGKISLRPPRSVQVLLSGRTRPFVCARDVSLELLRRGLGEAVARIEQAHKAPVIIEFSGPSARLLSVAERTVLASITPQVGAAGALFVSDERTEVFLRDQRRSKAHRALVPDPGAPCDEVINIDLSAVDPLFLDETGAVRSVRDLAGQPVSQVLLGGDSGATLRDLFAAAALLKSKRVPPRVEFLLAVPSRQMLEVLASSGDLADIIATGARLIEPDARVVRGELYPPHGSGLSVRTQDREPGVASKGVVVASAETLAHAVAHGEMGDPRGFKRPVRVTIPRALPTDDVLVVRDRKGSLDGTKGAAFVAPAPIPWKGSQTLDIVEGPAGLAGRKAPAGDGFAVVCSTLDEVRELATSAVALASTVRAILAPFLPSGLVGLFSGVGIAAIGFDTAQAKVLRGLRSITLPAPSQWGEGAATVVTSGSHKLSLTWLAIGPERAWTSSGTSRPAPSRIRSSA